MVELYQLAQFYNHNLLWVPWEPEKSKTNKVIMLKREYIPFSGGRWVLVFIWSQPLPCHIFNLLSHLIFNLFYCNYKQNNFLTLPVLLILWEEAFFSKPGHDDIENSDLKVNVTNYLDSITLERECIPRLLLIIFIYLYDILPQILSFFLQSNVLHVYLCKHVWITRSCLNVNDTILSRGKISFGKYNICFC